MRMMMVRTIRRTRARAPLMTPFGPAEFPEFPGWERRGGSQIGRGGSRIGWERRGGSVVPRVVGTRENLGGRELECWMGCESLSPP